MTTELQRPIGIIVNEDPQEVNWRNKVGEWAQGEISYEELLKHYPTYLLSIPERIVRFVQTKASQIIRKEEVVK